MSKLDRTNRKRPSHLLTTLTVAPALAFGLLAAGPPDPTTTTTTLSTGSASESSVASSASAPASSLADVSWTAGRHAFRDRGADVSTPALDDEIVVPGYPLADPADNTAGGPAAAFDGDTGRVSVQLVAAARPSVARIPLGARAVSVASAQKGKPYRYGAAGPRAFDCSGLVAYVYNSKLRQHLPRTANAQRKDTVRVAKNRVRPGDLVFFMRAGRAYHVGIYAGGGQVWHAPKPGKRVERVKLWTSGWVAGRVS